MAIRYVSPNGSNTAPYDTWAKAATSIGTAATGLSAGDIIEVDGGVDGIIYPAVNFTVTVPCIVRGSREVGHDGRVTHSRRILFQNTTGVVIVDNMDITAVLNSLTLFSFSAGCNVEFTNSVRIVGNRILGSEMNDGGAATVLFDGTVFADNIRDYNSSTGWRPLALCPASGAVFTFRFVSILYNGMINSSLFPGKMIFVGGNIFAPRVLNVFNNTQSWLLRTATTDLEVHNCLILGSTPVRGDAGSVPARSNFWHQSVYAPFQTTFNTGDDATLCLNSVQYVDPQVTNLRDCTLGQCVITIDDTGNSAAALEVAQVLNPEVKLTLSVNVHGAVNKPTAETIDIWRKLVKSGNEVRAHSSTHSDGSNLEAITVSATGTSPTCAITGTRIGDSSTWSGSLSVTINGTTESINLSTYASIGSVITWLNGRTIGDGTITATKADAEHSDTAMSLCLADTAEQSIASASKLLFNDAAFARVEVVECILDCESYILGGTDRNGGNAVAGMLETPPTSYACESYAAPYGNGRQTIADTLAAIPSVVGAVQAISASVPTVNIVRCGYSWNAYDFEYFQAVNDKHTFSSIALAAVSPCIISVLWHGENTCEWNGSVSNLKKLLVAFGLGAETFSEVCKRIRDNDDFSVSGQNITFIGDVLDYIGNADVRIKNQTSRLVHGGAVITGVNDGEQTDPWGNIMLTHPNIGADQYDYAPGFGPWATCTAPLPLSAQPCKGHALPIGVGKLTIFEGVASQAQIEESK